MTTTLGSPPRADPDATATRRRTPRRADVSSLAPLVLSVSVAPALARLSAHGMSARVLVPLVVAIVLADVVTALALRLRIHVALAVALGGALSFCSLLITVDPSVFDPGSAHFLHLSVISGQLRVGRVALANDGTPLPLLSGVVIILGAIGGAAAALTRGIWARQRRRTFVDQGRGPLSPCLAPSVAIFLYSTVVSAEQSRVPAFVSYFLGVLIFVVLADRTASAVTTYAATPPIPSIGRANPSGQRARGAGAVVACVLVALVAVAAGAGLSGMRLTVFHVTPAATGVDGGSPQNVITGISLVDSLLDTEITESHTVIFHASSPVRTYWQVGTLSSFNGTQWVPAAGVNEALAGSAGALKAALASTALPAPGPAETFTARVTITDFASRLLPAPPGTLSVHGIKGATAIPQEGVLVPSADLTDSSYAATAPLQSTLPTGGSQLRSSDPRLAPYLALPAQPAVVDQLARQAVGGATTPAAEAQALVNWFRSGRFRYTLSPPPTGGSDPLVQFLTVTKAGFCEQFAGAYGVLARSLGIPTRLVVGFTAGQIGSDGTTTVTGADAHVWPQVYLGPDAGWISVEPTPPSATGEPGAEGVVGPTGTSGSQNATASTAVAPTAPVTSAGASPAGSQSTPVTPPKGRRQATSARVSGHGFAWWAVIAVIAVLLLAALAVWAGRRRRTIREAALGPDERVVRAWERAVLALRRKGLTRRPDETPAEFAVRVGRTDVANRGPANADAVADLAGLVELACYTPRPCTPAQATRAQALAATIVGVDRSHRRRDRRQQTRA